MPCLSHPYKCIHASHYISIYLTAPTCFPRMARHKQALHFNVDRMDIEEGYDMILESAILYIKPGLASEFESAFREASGVLLSKRDM